MNFSARSYLVVGFIAIIGVLGQWSGDAFADLWRYPTAAWILALLYEGLRARLSKTDITLIAPKRASLGKEMHADLSIQNNSSRSVEIESMQVFPDDLTGERKITHWNIDANTLEKKIFTVTPKRLGKINWQRLYTRSLGRFRLAWWSRRIDLPGTLRVEPDRLHASERHSGTQQQGDINKHITGSGHELLGLRDYMPGDPLRSIDWKATARTGKHTIRLFTEEQHLELMLCIDAGRTSGLQAGKLTRLHHYANIAARLAEKAIINGDRVGMVIFADDTVVDMPPMRGAAALQRSRHLLEQLQTIPRESNPLNAALRVRELVNQRSLVVMFGDIDEATAARQLLRATQLLTPKHLPLLVGLVDRDIESLHTQPANDWLDPYYAFAARESRHASDKTILQLRRLGAHVVETLPEYLDQRVLGYYDSLRQRHSI